MDAMKDKRPRVTDEQLERLRNLSIENVWGAIQSKGYRQCFVTHLKQTQPGVKMVGRAMTMRYLPQRPDLDEGVRQLAKEGNWDPAFNVRGGEDAKPGDVVVVELGAMVDRATFMGTMTGLGMKLRGVKGVVVDGGMLVEHGLERQAVALTDFVVVEIVRRSDLDAARAELGIDVLVGDDRDRAVGQR